MTSEVVLRAEGLVKRFGDTVALNGIAFDLLKGEIHALCGENGAGKSTLIKVLSGIFPSGSYDGSLTVLGQDARFAGVRDAERAGIAVIYQELALVDEMSVAENIFLGCEPSRHGVIDWGQLQDRARSLLQRFRIDLDPDLPVSELGVGTRQLVEILKALRKDSNILILDEPTAALAEHEVRILLDILRDLSSRGISIIYISHKLDEVFAIADRITVIRDGRHVWTKVRGETSQKDVVTGMVGRDITDYYPRRGDHPSEPIMEISGLSVAPGRNKANVLKDISLSIRAGEILGIGGLMGAGRTELMMHLFGAWGLRTAGSITMRGKAFTPASPCEALNQGLVLVTEDRKRYGLLLEQNVNFNISLSHLRRLARVGILDSELEFAESRDYFDRMRIRGGTLDSIVAGLSGGNQQKVVLGKALMTRPSVVLLDEPTRGIDVGARVEIYESINLLTDAGCAVVMVSSDLPELLGMSNRIAMLVEGRVGGIFAAAEATQESLLQAALPHEQSARVAEEVTA
ncbi:MAG: ATP-binding cassette domain-containing protein [Candidatus Sumerlaeaceae bacterium]|nr:ATP-binding cassette domain-containing protein [Candidatus Sumerlaeaceae bacterium]